jgi:hypothetical protein
MARNGPELLERYRTLMAAIHRCRPLSGFCYTQLTDTFLEKNGLLDENRVPKAPIGQLADATRGPEAILHDWFVDPLGHSEKWRDRRGPNFDLEWMRTGADASPQLFDPGTPDSAITTGAGEGMPRAPERPGSVGPEDTPGGTVMSQG